MRLCENSASEGDRQSILQKPRSSPESFMPTARQNSQVAELSVTDAAQVATWFRVSSILLPLKSLRKLRISLNCNEPTPWANVNERAILDPVAPLAATANFDFYLELPRHCDDNIICHLSRSSVGNVSNISGTLIGPATAKWSRKWTFQCWKLDTLLWRC
jgi:hypothetical protein